MARFFFGAVVCGVVAYTLVLLALGAGLAIITMQSHP